jgi:hypothetical protein
MPRYYFLLTDGKHVLNNHKGIDLPGNAAARDDALALARDLKHGAVRNSQDIMLNGSMVDTVRRIDRAIA